MFGDCVVSCCGIGLRLLDVVMIVVRYFVGVSTSVLF